MDIYQKRKEQLSLEANPLIPKKKGKQEEE
jgi:hypothetical protein